MIDTSLYKIAIKISVCLDIELPEKEADYSSFVKRYSNIYNALINNQNKATYKQINYVKKIASVLNLSLPNDNELTKTFCTKFICANVEEFRNESNKLYPTYDAITSVRCMINVINNNNPFDEDKSLCEEDIDFTQEAYEDFINTHKDEYFRYTEDFQKKFISSEMVGFTSKIANGIKEGQTGIYLFLDSDDNIYYIGKAKSLKNRIRKSLQEHILNNSLYHKDKVVVKYFPTATKSEADLLEVCLITKYKPPYNKDCNHKDDIDYDKLKTTESSLNINDFILLGIFNLDYNKKLG